MASNKSYTRKRNTKERYTITSALAKRIMDGYNVFRQEHNLKVVQGDKNKGIPKVDFTDFGFTFRSYSTMRRLWQLQGGYKDYIESCATVFGIDVEFCNSVVNIAKVKGESVVV